MNTIYPYLYTRGAFLKKKLLRKEDYEKLLKMELPEIIKFLQESDYKKAIDDLALSLKGVDLAESALNASLAHYFRKIRNFADMESRSILDTYLERWDIYNAKTVLRALLSKTSVEKVNHLLIPAGIHGKEYFLELMKSGSIEEAIKRLDFIDEKKREQAASAFASGKSLLAVETILDQDYYTRMFHKGKQMGEEHFLFKRFLTDEVMILNLKTIMRLRSEGIDSAEVRKYLIQKEGKEDARLSAVISATTIEAMISEAQKGPYGKFVTGISGMSLFDVEIASERYLAEKYASSSFMNPLSIAPLLTIMFIKSAEVSNLKSLVKAKQLGMEQEFIEKVIAKW